MILTPRQTKDDNINNIAYISCTKRFFCRINVSSHTCAQFGVLFFSFFLQWTIKRLIASLKPNMRRNVVQHTFTLRNTFCRFCIKLTRFASRFNKKQSKLYFFVTYILENFYIGITYCCDLSWFLQIKHTVIWFQCVIICVYIVRYLINTCVRLFLQKRATLVHTNIHKFLAVFCIAIENCICTLQ